MAVLYLHIGRGKTGTTAIQRKLTANRKTLHEAGVHYVFADDQETGVGHQNFAKSFIRKLPGYMKPPREPDLVRGQVRQEISESGSPAILLSSENFTLANIPDLVGFLSNIPNVNQLRIIFYVRSQDEVAESQYNQLVKLGRVSMSFFEYLGIEMDEVDYNQMASAWADGVGEGNISARVFDARGAHLWNSFMSCLDLPSLPAANEVADEDVNGSIGYFATRLTRFLNRSGALNAAVSGRIRERLRDIDPPALFFDVDQARRYRERFAESNVRFTGRFFGSPVEDLGGRRYSDEERAAIREQIRSIDAKRLYDALESLV